MWVLKCVLFKLAFRSKNFFNKSNTELLDINMVAERSVNNSNLEKAY